MAKRKLLSQRYRRKLIQKESEIFSLISYEDSQTNVLTSDHILYNSCLSSNSNEISCADNNNFASNVVENFQFSDNVSVSNSSLNNISPTTASVNENIDEENFEFKPFLIQWAIAHHIPHVALTHLLSGLKKTHPIFSNLPKYAKTLLHTPHSATVIDMPPGQYCHIGIENSII